MVESPPTVADVKRPGTNQGALVTALSYILEKKVGTDRAREAFRQAVTACHLPLQVYITAYYTTYKNSTSVWLQEFEL